MTWFITPAQVITINAEVLGGEARVLNQGLLESACARPMATAFGQDAYPTLLEKGAALFHSLCCNHAFVDGNKRTATAALILFLERNGYMVTWATDDALAFIIAEGHHAGAAIAAWPAAHTRRTEP